jgi:hypothetical protein
MKLTNKDLAEIFKTALVAYEKKPNKGVGPDGYCYDTLAGGRAAVETLIRVFQERGYTLGIIPLFNILESNR